MGALELRNRLVDIIKSSDERFLRLVNELHKSYQKKHDVDFFTELPQEIQELLMESRVQARQKKTRTHEEVMDDFRKKYNSSGRV